MPSYRIIDGVRRAKVSQLSGRRAITAEIQTPDGVILEVREVAIEELRSAKAVIDLTVSAAEWLRYKSLENLVFQGLPMPAIIVMAGDGTPIADVVIIR